MKQAIQIILRYDLAIGKSGLNEIVYKLQQIQGPLMLEILKHIIQNYDDLISDRLSTVQNNPPSLARKGLVDIHNSSPFTFLRRTSTR